MTDLEVLDRIQRRVLWLATWMVHHANVIRHNEDGIKVGGHQASSASVVTLLTALYFKALRPGDAVAVKAHAAPAFYAIQYLRGRLDAKALGDLRVFGGLQAYPSRRKNPNVVDISTGSMGLGAVQASFGALAAQYVADHGGVRSPERVIVMVGDAELDEGNVWEALAEETFGRLRNVVWIVDINRQSLDRIVPDARRHQLPALFASFGWHVIDLRWGRRATAMFGRRGGERLRRRLEEMPYGEYQRLIRVPVPSVRKALVDPELDRLLGEVSDEELAAIVSDVGGHDLGSVLGALDEADHDRDRPVVILAHTIKGWGPPIAADPLNHTALLTAAQVAQLRPTLGVKAGDEWATFPSGSPKAACIRAPPPLCSPPSPTARPQIPAQLDESYTDAPS